MTADERYDLVHIKVERAKEHSRDLEAEVSAFFANKPYVIGTKRNPDTRQLIYYLVSIRDVPARLTLILGDALFNLRSALDHLAYQLVLVGGVMQPNSQHCFPIVDTDDPSRYETERRRKVTGMRQDAIDAIDALKPYKTGDETLWLLHRLNNVDKHRIVLAVFSRFRSLDLGGYVFRQMQRQFSGDPNFAHLVAGPAPEAFFREGGKVMPLKEGDELFIDTPDAEVDEQLQFRFDIAFRHPQIVEGQSLLETLVKMADVVENVILAFKPQLI
jgi:hypothetical protein